ncbi:MAG: EAL domain-containing protein [Xanthomonadales bacterium]|nr:EAL domain-containing protein [Xanthomonadales bacterium]
MQVSEPSSRRPRLRAAHVTQIPLRTADLCQRGKRLCESGWDINAALLLAQDAEALAAICRQLEERGTASRLEHFAENLWSLLEPPIVPDAYLLEELAARFAAFEAGSAGDADAALAHDELPSGLFGYAATEDNGFPLLTRPPSRYWSRFAALPRPDRIGPSFVEAAPASAAIEIDTAPIEPPAPEPPVTSATPELPVVAVAAAPVESPAATSAPSAIDISAVPVVNAAISERPPESGIDSTARIACHLHAGSDLAAAIDLQLGMLGFSLVHLDGVDALKDWLGRSKPSLIMLDGEHQQYIEEIGALVQAARNRDNQRILLIAHGAGKSDLAARLRAMRAGCDAYVVQPETADAVIGRIRELDLGAEADPFRIMIVEDDRSQAFFAESILRKNGMHTLAVGEASAVLDKLDEFGPDLILMDLNMPVCNGIELTALIREREAYLSTPIVFLSGEGDTEKHFEALSAGGDDFLTKPIAPRHLISAVTSRVRRARQVARHRKPVARETLKRGHTPAEISARMTELLAMEDAATRSGGILFIALESEGDLRRHLGSPAFAELTDQLAAQIEGQLGKNDMLARNGDSDFLLLNPDRSGTALEEFSAQLRKAVADHVFMAANERQEVSIAVGICTFLAAVGDARAMIEAAELALLDAPPIAEPANKANVVSIAQVPTDPLAELLRQALRDSSLRVVFQPIVSLHGEEEKQFQALLRLSSAEGRVYSAAELIPAAENAHLIGEVDRWMLESCLDTIAEHRRSGDNVRLFVNQSARSVQDPERIEWMRQALESRRIPAAQISIDLRMEDAGKHLAGYMSFALAMKQLGVSLTLSGVEGGDQATDMLMHLPVDFIKLSPRYTSDRGGDHRNELRDLVNLAHASGRRVIAPRVEEARVAASLWSSGIDLIQGNFVQQATRDASYDFKVAHA